MEVCWFFFVDTWKTFVPLSPRYAISGLIISIVQRVQERLYSGSSFLTRSILLYSHDELSSSVIQDIMTLHDVGMASMAYFYFDFKDVDKQNLQNLLPSLLIQLSTRSDARCDILSQLYSSHDRGVRKPNDRAMIKCLKEMLNLDAQGPTYIIMDAIDECSITSSVPSPREEVLDIIEELVDLHLPDVHICVTSRPELDIQAILGPLTPHPISLHDETGQKQDIADYIRSFVHGDCTVGGKPTRRVRRKGRLVSKGG